MNTDQITPTPTPRTDAATIKDPYLGNIVTDHFARELEIELARERRRAEENGRLAHDTAIQLAAERALADSLADALKQCLCGYTYDSDRALAAWKEARGA